MHYLVILGFVVWANEIADTGQVRLTTLVDAVHIIITAAVAATQDVTANHTFPTIPRRQCGKPMEIAVPVGEHEYRHVCNSAAGCSYVDYFNPKMVVGAIVQHEGKILLCRYG